MKRREFIRLLGGAAAVWPPAARAQRVVPRRIGYLGATTTAGERARTDAFMQRLRELGWADGQTIALEYRWAEGRSERFPVLAAELARLRPDLLVATSTAAALACKQATSVIPIVFPLAGDPLGTGLIASLSRPGANVTGLSNQAADLAGKRLEILRDVIPSLQHLAVLANAEYPGRISEIGDIRNAAQALRIDVAAFEVRRAEEIAPVLDSAVTQGAEALYVVGDTVLNSHRVHIASLAVKVRLPTMYVSRESVEAGGLMSYGANIPHLFSRAAEIVDKILRGAKAGDIPVEQPTKFDLVINPITARALGLDVPPTLLVRADEVIE
jgi:putative tryptophan/tyrosine transport system substrate-binding protein